MTRIRLQIQVVDSQQSPSAATIAARQSEIRPWTQPEDADNTLAQLVENIGARYGRIYVGKSALRVKELQDSWGSTLDLTDKIGDVFDDRSSNREIFTSICKVIRYPPDVAELHNAQRFVSLAPESTARPQKRPPPPLFHDSNRPLPSVEEATALPRNRHTSQAHKRQKTHHARIPSRDNRPSGSNQGHAQAVIDSSQLASSQRSVHQVLDSQPSPRRVANPYGTPTSLSSRQQCYAQQDDNPPIPDSPSIGNLEDRNVARDTKSESPVLRMSVHDVAPPEASQAQQEPEPIVIPSQIDLAEHDRALQENDNQAPPEVPSSEVDLGNAGSSQIQEEPALQNEPALPQTSPSPATNLLNGHTIPKRKGRENEIYDPIESDSEGFENRQQMFNAKQHRLTKTPSRPFVLPPPPPSVARAKSSSRVPCDSVAKPNAEVPSVKKPRTFSASTDQASSSRASEHQANGINGVTNDEHPAKLGNVDKANPHVEGPTSTIRASKTSESALIQESTKAKVLNGNEEAEVRGSAVRPPDAPAPQASNNHDALPASSQDLDMPNGHLDSDMENRRSADITVRPDGSTSLSQKNPSQKPEDVIVSTVSAATDPKGMKKQNNNANDVDAAAPALQEPGPAKGEMRAKEVRITNKDTTGTEQLAVREFQPEAGAKQRSPKKRAVRQPDDFTVNHNERDEQQLEKQGERAMLAAEGAKQLQIEKTTPKPAAVATPKTNDWAKTPSQPPSKQLNAAQRKAQERKERDAIAAQKFREQNFQNGEFIPRSSQASESERASIMARRPVKAHRSSPSDISALSHDRRQSFTPMVPGSNSSKLNPSSSPHSANTPTAMRPPPRSALKPQSSSLRRSISQVSFNNNHDTYQTLQAGKGSSVGAASSGNVASSGRKSTPRANADNQPSKKRQSTLNVTRDKKMKGRAVNPPSPVQSAQPIEAPSPEPSVSDFSSVSSEDNDPKVAKAGPSIKRSRKLHQAEHTSSPAPDAEQISSSIDPALQALTPSKNAKPRQTLNVSSTSVTKTSVTKRGAKATEPVDVSSAASSDSESESESGSDSSSGSTQSSKPPVIKQEPGVAKQNANSSSQSSSAASSSMQSSTRSDAPVKSEKPQKIPQHVPGKPNTSLPNSRPTSSQLPKGTLLSTMRTSNATRPHRQPYPSLSELKHAREGGRDSNTNPTPKPLSTSLPTQKSTAVPPKPFQIGGSDSEDDDSSSSSESDEEEGKAQQPQPKQQQQSKGYIPGFDGIKKCMFFMR